MGTIKKTRFYQVFEDTDATFFCPLTDWSEEASAAFRTEGIPFLRLSESAGWRDHNLDCLSDIAELQGLEVFSTRITDLTPVYKFCDLRILSIQANLTTELELSCFKQLERFCCFWSSKIRNLESLTMLEYLNIVGYPYQSLNSLRGMTRLKRLLLTSNNLVSLAGIQKLVNVNEIDLFECPRLADISEVSKLGENSLLESITIEDCGDIESVGGLADCAGVTKVRLKGNTVVVDGRLRSLLEECPLLSHIEFADREHYDLTLHEARQLLRKRRKKCWFLPS